MTFPSATICLPMPAIPTLDRICLPGGVCLDYIWDSIGKIPSAADMAMDFYSQIGPAMAPLAPVFNILDTVLAIFRCVQAIPDAITQLNPSELIKCVPGLAQAVDKLLDLIPQLSLPKMIIALLNNTALLLREIAGDLSFLENQAQRVLDGIDRAATLNDHTLNGLLVCAQGTLADTALSTGEALRGIGSIILLMNLLMGLFGGPEIPCLGSTIGDNLAGGLAAVIEVLTALAGVLSEIALAIPDPDLALTLALGDQQC